jgi:hypothetical protein
MPAIRSAHYGAARESERRLFGPAGTPATVDPADLDLLARVREHARASLANVRAQVARKRAIARMKATLGR